MTRNERAPGSGDRPPGAGRLLIGAVRHTGGRLSLLIALMVLSTAASLALPALLAAAVNAVLHGDSGAAPALAWGAVMAAGAVCDTLMAPLGAVCAAQGTRWLQQRTVGHLLSMGGRSPVPAGEAVSQVTQAAQQAGALPVAVAGWGVTVTGSAAALAALLWLDWRCGLAFLICVPVTVLIARRFVGRVTRVYGDYLSAQSGIAVRLLAALTGARTIRASGTLDRETDRVLAPLREVSVAGHRIWRLQKGTVWQFGLLISLTEALVLGVAGLGVVDGRLSPGQFVAVAGYLQLAFPAVQQIDVFFTLAQARAAAVRLAGTFAHAAVRYGTAAAAPGAGAVSFRGVTVRAAATDGAGGAEGTARAAVLDGIDLDIPAGACVAFVGRTASGKSALAGLPGRLADPDEGEVLLDGRPVRELAEGPLRDAVTYAFERPALLGGTVREAIGYGRPGLPRSAVRDAARAAAADGFVRKLPEGYDTPLERVPLSGGERQRLGLARTLARPARVYVLDDATSGLDTVTEAEVSAAVTGALIGRTRIVVAHRVATAARCDRVVWLDGGRIRASGPHAELWHDPAYRAVFAADEAGDGAGIGDDAQAGDGGSSGTGGGPDGAFDDARDAVTDNMSDGTRRRRYAAHREA
ncbi:ATP-binding cassette, subfamily B [Actinacidiphila alni]|uniref:ATP-binding cassette, subfamily B n=1 Tax=Actinacidiphila alni TaxID=380248 RepID=A0A1I2KJA1_9ACTN|nr:ABC transporter ATP-binding protein [Actinacidiphila alni]SFF66320.1 ATP-binding cassette, subfamily B [Actinacidiphila alni]